MVTMARLTPLPMEAQQAQSDWLLEQFDNNRAPDGTFEYQGTNYPGHPDYQYFIGPKYQPPEVPTLQDIYEPMIERQLSQQAMQQRFRRAATLERLSRFEIAIPRPVSISNLRALAYGHEPPTIDEMPYECQVVYLDYRDDTGAIFRCDIGEYTYSTHLDRNTLERYNAGELRQILTSELIREINAHRQRTESPV